jgi:hypothetical protein
MALSERTTVSICILMSGNICEDWSAGSEEILCCWTAAGNPRVDQDPRRALLQLRRQSLQLSFQALAAEQSIHQPGVTMKTAPAGGL